MIIINDGSDITRWRVGEGVALQQSQDLRGAFEQASAQVYEPGILLIMAQGGEPHLPVESGLMGLDELWATFQIAGFVFELVFEPGDAVVAAFNDDFGPGSGHDGKEAVTVEAAERHQPSVKRGQWSWPGEGGG